MRIRPLLLLALTAALALASAFRSVAQPVEGSVRPAEAAASGPVTAGVPPCQCDLTGDGIVSAPDRILLLDDYTCQAGVGLCPGDCNGDGVTGMPDYIRFLQEDGRIDCP